MSEERGHGEGRVVYATLLSGSHAPFFFCRQIVAPGRGLVDNKTMQVSASPGPYVVLVPVGKFVVLNLGR